MGEFQGRAITRDCSALKLTSQQVFTGTEQHDEPIRGGGRPEPWQKPLPGAACWGPSLATRKKNSALPLQSGSARSLSPVGSRANRLPARKVCPAWSKGVSQNTPRY